MDIIHFMENRDEILNSFGKKLQKLRTDRNLSQEKLAEIGGFDRTYISLLERGVRNPSLVNIFRLAKALNITPDKLLKFE
jgi:transcriptional regulator with XRE-family HTH domain